MTVYVVLGYDEYDNGYEETFECIFDTKEKAIEYMQNDFDEDECDKYYNHQEYTIVEYDVTNNEEIARYDFTDNEGELVAGKPRYEDEDEEEEEDD